MENIGIGLCVVRAGVLQENPVGERPLVPSGQIPFENRSPLFTVCLPFRMLSG